ncbi:hypothetical protein ACWEQL_38580 [Kitasatospora sp. NPDC004240]
MRTGVEAKPPCGARCGLSPTPDQRLDQREPDRLTERAADQARVLDERHRAVSAVVLTRGRAAERAEHGTPSAL